MTEQLTIEQVESPPVVAKTVTKHDSRTVFSTERFIAPPSLPSIPFELNKQLKMDGLSFLERLPNDSFPTAFFDPQYRSVLDKQRYGNEGKSRQIKRAQLPQMSTPQIERFIENIYRTLIPSGHLFLWCDKYVVCAGDIAVWTLNSGFKVVDMVTWYKERMGMGYRTRRTSEHLIVLQKPPVRAKGVWTDHSIHDVWSERVPSTHPHSKPVKLQQTLIKAVTNEGDVVIDPAAGGYSVLRAANEVGRNFLGCDIYSE